MLYRYLATFQWKLHLIWLRNHKDMIDYVKSVKKHLHPSFLNNIDIEHS